MKRALRNIYYFLPVQLLLLHFRKYQLLLSFWLILVLVITKHFAAHFGASSLFLSPEYLGQINFAGMVLMGAAMCVFMMTWHITTFIIHSKRMPYMGATRHAFLVYCINNAIIPVSFLIFYTIVYIRFQYLNEHAGLKEILVLQGGFYIGFITVVLLSFAYFFRVSRDFIKSLLTNIAKPSRIRKVIPYDTLDYEIDIVPARSFITGHMRIRLCDDLPPYNTRVLNKIMSRHHRNVLFAAVFAYLCLLIMGIYMDQPLLRIPAGAGFMLLFAMIMGFVGAFKYFLKSWEAIGWITFALVLSVMVRYRIFDLRSIAYGLNYKTGIDKRPTYDYENLHKVFNAQRFEADRQQEESRLDKWKALNSADSNTLVVITTSGGGLRSAYWTFRTLQYIDSVSHGRLFKHTVLITGASGGMIGATYWRAIHDAWLQGRLKNRYAFQYQANMGKDLLNPIIFSLACVDLISPFNKISIGGYSYTRDRGYAMEQELVTNTDSLLDKSIAYYAPREATGQIPQLIVNSTIINDGRKLMMGNLPLTYLTQPEYSLQEAMPPIDAVDYSTFFAGKDPGNIRITSCLRMNATFPFVLPVVRLPSTPYMNIMDAGLRDNFGSEMASRYMFTMRDWINKNVSNAIFLEIRDSRECDVSAASNESSFANMLMDPLFVIQNKWEAFQSYKHSIIKDLTPMMAPGKMHYISLVYMPKESKTSAALSFHLTSAEKEDLYRSIYYKDNQAAIEELLKVLK